jgi:beta-glucosidase-like glycosyl hydrolase
MRAEHEMRNRHEERGGAAVWVAGVTAVALCGVGGAVVFAPDQTVNAAAPVRNALGLGDTHNNAGHRASASPSAETSASADASPDLGNVEIPDPSESASPSSSPSATASPSSKPSVDPAVRKQEKCVSSLDAEDLFGIKFMLSVYPANMKDTKIFTDHKIKHALVMKSPKNPRNGSLETFKKDALGFGADLAVDDEGGQVQRLFKSKHLLSEQEMARKHTPKEAGQIMEEHYKDLKEIGIDTVEGPVVDVEPANRPSILGDRVFSKKKEVVAAFGKAYRKAADRAGIRATFKHFPGYGPATANTDEHPGVSDSYNTRNVWPYQPDYLGDGNIMITTAHVPGLGAPKTPATQAKKTYQVIRKVLGFKDTVTISDDLATPAVQGPLPEAVTEFYDAGGDIALIVQQEPRKRKANRHQVNAIEKVFVAKYKDSPEFRTAIKTSAARILASEGIDACDFAEQAQ